MDIRTAAQIAGLTNPRTDEASDHPITPEERALAIEVGHEIAARHGLDLAAYVRAAGA
jgi:hypothetical protein